MDVESTFRCPGCGATTRRNTTLSVPPPSWYHAVYFSARMKREEVVNVCKVECASKYVATLCRTNPDTRIVSVIQIGGR